MPKLRTPAVSTICPPPGRSTSRATVVVWRPRPITSLIAPVGSARPVRVFESVVLPTPECPASTARRVPISVRTSSTPSPVRFDTCDDRVPQPAQERGDARDLRLVVRQVDLRQCERRVDASMPGRDEVAVDQVGPERGILGRGDDDQQVDVGRDHLRTAPERGARQRPPALHDLVHAQRSVRRRVQADDVADDRSRASEPACDGGDILAVRGTHGGELVVHREHRSEVGIHRLVSEATASGGGPRGLP